MRFGQRHGAALALGMSALALTGARQWRRDIVRARALARDEQPPRLLDRAPRVSILVAAWNEADVIERHVESVVALAYPDFEYVLCAGGGDDTLERARRTLERGRTRSILIEQTAGEGKQRALDRAFGACTGEIVVLTDADCLLDTADLLRIVEPLAVGRASAATGGYRPLDEQWSHPLARYQAYRERYWQLRSGVWADGVLGRNAAISRETLAAVGAFRSRVATGTDYHLSGLLRSNRVGIVRTRSEVRTRVPTTPDGYVRMWQRWTKNLLVQGATSGRTGEAVRALIAALSGAALLAGPLCLVVGGWAGVGWVLLALRAWLERARQCAVASFVEGRHEGSGFYLALWLYTVADSIAAASAPVLLLRADWRRRW